MIKHVCNLRFMPRKLNDIVCIYCEVFALFLKIVSYLDLFGIVSIKQKKVC